MSFAYRPSHDDLNGNFFHLVISIWQSRFAKSNSPTPDTNASVSFKTSQETSEVAGAFACILHISANVLKQEFGNCDRRRYIRERTVQNFEILSTRILPCPLPTPAYKQMCVYSLLWCGWRGSLQPAISAATHAADGRARKRSSRGRSPRTYLFSPCTII